MHRLAIVIGIGVVLAACDGDPEADAGARDAAPTCEALAPFDEGDADGAADPLGAGVGEARAGRIDEADLPTDPDGLATWRDGDLALANDRVAMLISTTPREAYDPFAGRIVGIARVEDGALVAPADFNALLLGVGRFLVETDSVSVLSDGSDGGPAVIRARGALGPIETLADLLDGFLPEDFTGLPGAMDYELAPDTEHVDVFVSVRADTDGVRTGLGVVQVFFQAYRMPPWAPGTGFGVREEGSRFLAFTDDDATSYAWMAPEGTLSQLFGDQGIDLFTSNRLTVAPCGEARVHVGRLVIGGPGLPGVQAAVARVDDAETTRVEGTVLEADGSPATDVRVHVTTADGEHVTRTYPEADGTFALDVDPRAAQLFAWRPGDAPVGPVALDAGTITMPAYATVEITATDADGAPTPVRVEILPEAAVIEAPIEWGERSYAHGRSHLAFPTDGQVSLRVAPGRHRVRVEHGPEHERYEQAIDVAAGDVSMHAVTLERVVPTPGVMCADYHIHSHRSVDSSDPGALKVASLVADGLEIAIRSEHEWVSDYAPVIADLGLEDHAYGIAGFELTTFTYGHFGVFPLVPDPSRPSGGAIPWFDRLAPDVFEEVRARPEAPALIINHPRAGGLRQGYFSEAGYDPDTGTVGVPELWDEAFSVVEVFNGTDFERNRDESVRDWFSLLESGRRVFAVGASDSHELDDNLVGYPRTCLYVGTDDVADLTDTIVRDATVNGRAYVSGGVYLDVRGPDDVGPGEEAAGVGATAPFVVTILAASHVDVDRLEVFVDGASVETIPILDDDADPLEPWVRARVDVDVDVDAAGSWVVFYAAGTEPYDVHGHVGYAVSNPVFLSR